MDERYTSLFRWLIVAKSFTENSASDVISRIKRARTIMDIDVPIDIDTLLFHFTGKSSFKKLTTTVKSQLKRAIRLYKEFNANSLPKSLR